MTRTILAFGDSNTHGTKPMPDHAGAGRFDRAERWPGAMADALGDGWHLVEEGLPGRTAAWGDVLMGDHMNGQTGLKIALASHAPIDVLVIVLGTNDVKARLGLTAEGVAAGIAGLLDIANDPDTQAAHAEFRTLLVCPPPITEGPPFAAEMRGGAALSRALPALLEPLAEAHGVAFLDAGRHIAVSPTDGVHFDADAHRTLGHAIARAIDALH